MNQMVYVLSDPRTDEVRYVGQCVNAKNRLQQHMATARFPEPSTPKVEWIRELKAAGHKPIMHVLRHFENSQETNDAEHALIVGLRRAGFDLYNANLPLSSTETPMMVRIRPEVRKRLDGFIKRNPKTNKMDLYNDAVDKELERREAYEYKG